MKSNRNNIIALAVVGFLAIAPALLAQDSTNTTPNPLPAGGSQRGGMMRGPSIDQLATALNLTDDQKTNIAPILASQRQQMMALRQDQSLSMDDRRAKMQAIRQDTMTKMQAILTPDQFTKYQQTMQRMRRSTRPPSGDTNAPAASPTTPPPPQQ